MSPLPPISRPGVWCETPDKQRRRHVTRALAAPALGIGCRTLFGTRFLALGSALLIASLATACTGDQSYTPIGEDQADELCQKSILSLNEVDRVALDVDASGRASYSDFIEVTHSSRTEMHVDTDEIIISIPAQRIAAVSVAAGDWEVFTDMVFAVDLRQPGSSEWQAVSFSSTEGHESFWFKDIDFDAITNVAGGSTLDSCSTASRDHSALDLDFDITDAYEMRIRPFPFKGLGDLVGQYDYTIDVEISE